MNKNTSVAEVVNDIDHHNIIYCSRFCSLVLSPVLLESDF
jgi:hypothetical protein